MIKIEKVIKSYIENGEENNILNINSLIFEDNTTYLLKGESGTGKSTLLNIISGLMLPDTGSICFDDTDITIFTESERDRFRAKNIGYVFQDFNLFKGFTALDNVIMPITFKGEKTKFKDAEKKGCEVLNEVGLVSKAKISAEKLSGGEKQRIAIARAIINNPLVILADEPTGNLDRKNSVKIIDLLIDISKKKKIILITISHDLSYENKFDKVIDFVDFNKITTLKEGAL